MHRGVWITSRNYCLDYRGDSSDAHVASDDRTIHIGGRPTPRSLPTYRAGQRRVGCRQRIDEYVGGNGRLVHRERVGDNHGLVDVDLGNGEEVFGGVRINESHVAPVEVQAIRVESVLLRNQVGEFDFASGGSPVVGDF